LKVESAHLPELNDQLDQLRGSIPAGVDSSAYLDGLNALATVSGVQITTLTVGSATAYQPAVAPAPAAADGDATDAAPADPAVNPAIVTNALITSANFVTVPVSLTIAGSYPSILSFIEGLQTGGRLFLVSNLTTNTDGTTGGITSNISGYIYAIPTGLPGNPHPTSTIVKVMSTAAPATDGTDATGTDGSTDGATGTSPTPNPTATTAP
jgi:hypothetical protein